MGIFSGPKAPPPPPPPPNPATIASPQAGEGLAAQQAKLAGAAGMDNTIKNSGGAQGVNPTATGQKSLLGS